MSVPTPGQEPTITTTPGAESTSTATTTTPEAKPTTAVPNTQTTLPTELPDVNNDAAWEGIPSWVRTTIKELRGEAAGYRVKANETQTALDAINREKMTETEKLQADLKKFNDEVLPAKDKAIRELQVQVLAGTKDVVDTEAVVALLDWDQVNAGKLSVSDALDALLEKKDYLKKQPATSTTTSQSSAATPSTSSSANPGTQNTALPTFTQSQIAGMSTRDMEVNSDAIKQAMADGRVDYTR